MGNRTLIRNKYIGDRQFYKTVLAVAVPMMVQTGITNFVSLLDNIMVGRVGTEQMSGVAISNQLLFVFYLCLFGGVSGVGIFTAQYHGNEDNKGVRDTFRFKMLLCLFIGFVGILIFYLFDDQLISLYLHESDGDGDLALTLQYGKDYMRIMLIGLLPMAILQAYSGTLRETGETILPMKAGIIAVIVNLGLNTLLIFGYLGFPALGVKGAAIATVVSRFVELAVVVVVSHRNKDRNQFLIDAYKSFRFPKGFIRLVSIKALPILFNEALWSAGVAMVNQCYSQRGLEVVAGINIASAIINVFNVVYLSLGTAVGIIVGNLLGADKKEEARDTDTKLITFAVLSGAFIGIIMYLIIAPYFPLIYNTSDSVRSLAQLFIRVSACITPAFAFTHASYFTLRAGGKTLVTLIFDCGFMWCISVPAAFIIANFTELPIMPFYIICQSLELIKLSIGYIFVKKGVWINRIIQ